MCPTLAARTAEIRLGIDSTTFFMTQVFELTHSCATKFVSSALRLGDFWQLHISKYSINARLGTERANLAH